MAITNRKPEKCKACGGNLKPRAKFCAQCGAKIEMEWVCASCGAKLIEGDAFCSECGAKVVNMVTASDVEPKQSPKLVFVPPEGKALTLPEGVGVVTKELIDGIENFDSYNEIVIPASTAEISSYVFKNRKNICRVHIPDSISKIGGFAFQDCEALEAITLPKNLRTIGKQAFQGCVSLTYVEIPENVETIGGLAFNGCTSLKQVDILNSGTVLNMVRNPEKDIFFNEDSPFENCHKKLVINHTVSMLPPAPITKNGCYNTANRLAVMDDVLYYIKYVDIPGGETIPSYATIRSVSLKDTARSSHLCNARTLYCWDGIVFIPDSKLGELTSVATKSRSAVKFPGGDGRWWGQICVENGICYAIESVSKGNEFSHHMWAVLNLSDLKCTRVRMPDFEDFTDKDRGRNMWGRLSVSDNTAYATINASGYGKQSKRIRFPVDNPVAYREINSKSWSAKIKNGDVKMKIDTKEHTLTARKGLREIASFKIPNMPSYEAYKLFGDNFLVMKSGYESRMYSINPPKYLGKVSNDLFNLEGYITVGDMTYAIKDEDSWGIYGEYTRGNCYLYSIPNDKLFDPDLRLSDYSRII